jgi:hypothetical protein
MSITAPEPSRVYQESGKILKIELKKFGYRTQTEITIANKYRIR